MSVIEGLDDADRAYHAWASPRLASGDLAGWIAEDAGSAVASGCLWLQPVQPRPGWNAGRRPYLLSMFTEPSHRGHGLATRIVQEAVRWSAEHGFPAIALHASDAGRGVYEKLGFERTWEMRFDVPRGGSGTSPSAAARDPGASASLDSP